MKSLVMNTLLQRKIVLVTKRCGAKLSVEKVIRDSAHLTDVIVDRIQTYCPVGGNS